MFNTCTAKRILSLLMAFCILVDSSLVLAKMRKGIPVHEPQFEGQAYEGLKWFTRPTEDYVEWEQQINEQLDQLQPEDNRSATEKIAATDNIAEVITRFNAAAEKAYSLAHQRFLEIGAEEFTKELERDKIAFDIDGIPVEYTAIEGYPAARIKHEKSGVALVFIDKNVINADSKALLLYLARQHFDAGRTRLDKRYYEKETDKKTQYILGREQLIVWTEKQQASESQFNSTQDKYSEAWWNNLFGITNSAGKTQISKVEFKPRHKKHSKEWWNEWWRATWQKPTLYHARVGLKSGAAQTVMVSAVAALFTFTAGMMGADVVVEQPPEIVAALSFVFGSTIGLFTRTYQNWRSRGAPEIKQRKDEVVNVAMYFSIKAVSRDGFFSTFFNVLDASKALATGFNWAQFFVTFKINNALKQPWNRFGDIRSEKRDDQGNVLMPIPVGLTRNEQGKLKVSWKYADILKLKKIDWNKQFKYYLPRNAITMGDRIWFTWFMHEYVSGNAEWYMPWLSTVGTAMMVPVSWALLKWWVHKNYPNTPQEREVFQEAERFLTVRGITLSMVGAVPFIGKTMSDAIDEQIDRVPPAKVMFSGIPKWLRSGSNVDMESPTGEPNVIDFEFDPPLEEEGTGLTSPELPNNSVDEPQPLPVQSSDCAKLLKKKSA